MCAIHLQKMVLLTQIVFSIDSKIMIQMDSISRLVKVHCHQKESKYSTRVTRASKLFLREWFSIKGNSCRCSTISTRLNVKFASFRLNSREPDRSQCAIQNQPRCLLVWLKICISMRTIWFALTLEDLTFAPSLLVWMHLIGHVIFR